MNAREMFEEQRYKRNEENDEITYLQRFGSGYFRITFDLSKEEIAIDTNMENVIESDLLQAIIQQVKELHWLDEKAEIKEERNPEVTNFEHYKDRILDCCLDCCIDNLAVVKGRPTLCCETNCDDCDFKINRIGCREMAKYWLKQPYKKLTYKLNKFEFDLLNAHKDSGMQKCISNYRPLLELHEKGYFKDIDTSTPIHEILDNCEVV